MKKETAENKKVRKNTKMPVPADETKQVETAVEEKALENDGRVGTMLKETRLKKGGELDEIAQILRIRKNYLEAIEDSNYDELPPAPYGQGFVRAYADYLGLNAVRMAQLYREETDANSQKKDLYMFEPQSEATVPNRKYIILSLLAIILIYAGWVLYSRPSTDLSVATAPVVDGTTPSGNFPLEVEEFEVEEPAVAEKTSEQEAAEIQKEVEKAAAQKTEEEKTEELPVIEVTSEAEENTPQVIVSEASFNENAEPENKIASEAEINNENKSDEDIRKAVPQKAENEARVVMKVKKETWIEAKNADKLYISKVVQDGFTYNVPDEKGMIISAGRYDAVDVYVDGKLTTVFTEKKKTGISVDKLLETAENH